MKITISGLPGAGKSSISKFLSKKLGLKQYSVGDFRRKKAQKMSLNLQEFNKLGEKKDFTDKLADKWQKTLSKKDKFVIDGRLSWYFIPDSIKIFISVSEKKGAERIFREKRETEKKCSSIEEVLKENKKRIKSDIKRYKKYYHLNPYQIENYDIVMDTSNLTEKQQNDFILKAILDFKKKK